MSFSGISSRHTTRREKVFGPAPGVSLDRNAKARIMVFVRAYNSRMREGRQHTGPVTRAFMDVLRALLYSFHNSRDGRCFPSYERIAQAANCARSTVYEAIRALERAGVLTWVNRLTKIRVPERDGVTTRKLVACTLHANGERTEPSVLSAEVPSAL